MPHSIHDLPVELDERILGLVPYFTLAGVCRVSKRYHTVGTRVLYRHLPLYFAPDAVMCFTTLLRNDVAAEYVRDLSLLQMLEYDGSTSFLSAFFILLSKVLPRLFNLRDLTIHLGNPGSVVLTSHFDFILCTCNFPHLEDIRFFGPVTHHMISFLHKHRSTIERVMLVPLNTADSVDEVDHILVESSTLAFQKLDMLFTTVTFARNILCSPLPSLQNCLLTWMDMGDPDMDPSKVIEALATSQCDRPFTGKLTIE
ncbi:hypothetical protein VNI00_016253 [Paramarasmius palmivorus]|uniref:F-box domain-containing protein n=1 Tax=Paramarasmius palmivorus TaxID=297713 RepID=A0AAW0BFC1_9AGAR